MAPLPTRKSLESLKRADLQKLCKDYGVRANLRSEALIDLLDATRQSNPPPSSQPQRTSSTRIVSTHSSSRSRLRSGGSVVIHDTDDEDEENTAGEQLPSDAELKHDPPPVTRTTRKAKDTQFRLGVGRPKVAGGAGARAVTKSLSVPKGKRISKSVKVTEAVIPEEHESESPNNAHRTPTDPGPSGVEHNHTPSPPVATPSDFPQSQGTHSEPNPPSILSLDKINDYINELVRPLQQQIRSFKTELDRLNTQVAELTETKASLTIELEILRGQTRRIEDQVTKMKQSSNGISPAAESEDSARRPSSSNETKSGVPHPPTSHPLLQGTMFPGESSTTLGKRHRDSFTSDLTGIIESDAQAGLSEEELAQKVVRPQKKRPKIEARSHPDFAGPSHQESTEEASAPAFTVFSGPEERSDYVDPPPPTTHLSDLFGHPSPMTPGNDIRTNSANGPENTNPFGMSFSAYQAVTSTPVYATNGLASYLERPESPTSHVIERAGRQDRASPFFLHGRRSDQHDRPSPSYHNGDGHEPNADPLSALLKTPPLHAVREPILAVPNVSSTDIGLGMGMSDIRVDDTPAPPVKRTMYGTELEADTRFGDFGVEGMATGYWQGARRRQ